MGSETSDNQTVSKEIEPDEIITLTVNDSGQGYFDTDLAGCELAVAYEVLDRPDEDVWRDTGGSATGGGDPHRYILQQCQTLLQRFGAEVSLPTQSGDEQRPDAIADFSDLPSPAEATSVNEGQQSVWANEMRLPRGKQLYIEAETSTVQKPTQVLKNLANAINHDAVCVFVCPRELKSSNMNPGELIETIIYQSDGGTINYDTINCAQSGDETRTLYQKSTPLTVEQGHTVVMERSGADRDIKWIKDGREVIAVASDTERELFRFDNQDGFPPSGDDTLHRQHEDKDGWWAVKHGYGNDAEVQDAYGDLDILREDYEDVYAPFIPEREFDRQPSEDDFVILLFPSDDSDNTEPMIYEQGETRPLFGDDTTNRAE